MTMASIAANATNSRITVASEPSCNSVEPGRNIIRHQTTRENTDSVSRLSAPLRTRSGPRFLKYIGAAARNFGHTKKVNRRNVGESTQNAHVTAMILLGTCAEYNTIHNAAIHMDCKKTLRFW